MSPLIIAVRIGMPKQVGTRYNRAGCWVHRVIICFISCYYSIYYNNCCYDDGIVLNEHNVLIEMV